MAGPFRAFPATGRCSPASCRRRARPAQQAITDRGIDYVGQELVRLSTTPVWEQGRITPRPFVLRVFAAATPQGWTIMPGGFCRIADEADARAVSMGDGARSADVWVVSDKAVSASTLLPAAEAVRIRRIAGVVPSRAADNLFWLGRYLERAEATLRLIRALGAPMRDPVKGSSTALPSVERIQRLLVTWGATSQATRTNPQGSSPRRCRARTNSARPCHWQNRRSAPRVRCASGFRPTPGRSSPRWWSASPCRSTTTTASSAPPN